MSTAAAGDYTRTHLWRFRFPEKIEDFVRRGVIRPSTGIPFLATKFFDTIRTAEYMLFLIFANSSAHMQLMNVMISYEMVELPTESTHNNIVVETDIQGANVQFVDWVLSLMIDKTEAPPNQ